MSARSVRRGFLTVITVANPPTIRANESGRRQLADWLTRPDHPLTSRVIVNRVWAKLFGAGIVPTVDDFGDQGQKPTNPELLDYLAVRFVDQGWSVKKSIKEMVLEPHLPARQRGRSRRTWPRTRRTSPLWRWNRKRLDAEALRDTILRGQGQLDLDRPRARRSSSWACASSDRYSDFSPIQKPSRHRSVYLPVLRNKPARGARTVRPAGPEPGRRDNAKSRPVPTQGLFF